MAILRNIFNPQNRRNPVANPVDSLLRANQVNPVVASTMDRMRSITAKTLKPQVQQAQKIAKPVQRKQEKAAAFTNIAKPGATKELGAEVSQTPAQQMLAQEQMQTASGVNVGKGGIAQVPQPQAPQPAAQPTAQIQRPEPQAMQPQAPQGSQALSQLQALRQRLAGTMTPTEQERALADELAGLRGEYQTAIAGEEGAGRGRTLGLV